MKKSTNFSAEKGRRLKIFATIFAAIFALIALATGLALKNYGRGRTDLTQTTAAATAPTDTSKYWTDEAAWSAADKDFNNYTLSGSGGQDDPYLIQNEWDLAYLSWTIYTNHPIQASHVSTNSEGNCYYSGIYFEQTADLDLSAYYWQPIGIRYLRGGASASRYFSGCYDGGSHTVSGVFTPAGEGNGYSYQGLFGYVYGRSSTNLATISNVGVIDSFVQGYAYVGVVVGYGRNQTTTNCYNTGSVEGSSTSYCYVGGVVGRAASSTIENCYNTGSVSASGGHVGGVVGYAISSITITNCYNTGLVEGVSQVGGVVGEASSISTVTNCYNTGSVEGSSLFVGGVVGEASSSSTITNCYNAGSVSGSGSQVGGVVGEASSSSTIKNCYNTGSVSGEDSVGGVVGQAASSTIENCYNTGSVESSSFFVGGVVGEASSSSTITNCYNTGSVSGLSYVGGVVGGADSSDIISNTYYGGDCTLSKGIGSGSGSAVKIDKPVEEWAKSKEWYSADAVNSDGSLVWSADSPWDFENVWGFNKEIPEYITGGYPLLKNVDMGLSSDIIYWTDEAVWSAADKDFNNYTLSGSGSPGDPYLIQSEWDLAYLSWTIYTKNPILASHVSGSRYYSDVYFEQTADLDLSAYYWQPIGIQYLRDGTSATRSFSGSYDGGSHTVSGLFTPAGEGNGYSYQGLFGHVYGQSSSNLATISNVGVIDSFVQGDDYVGGVVGRSLFAMVDNCYNTGSVSGSTQYSGGVVGYGSATNCYNTGSVEGYRCVGGVAGFGTATNCYNTGSVEGSDDYVGGVIGEAEGDTVENCYNTGSVEGYRYVGGVVGFTLSGGAVTNCYNTGSVSGSGSQVGGVVGYAYSSSSTVTNCYNSGSVSGSSHVGGVVGYAYSGNITITNCYNTGLVSSSGNRVGGVVGYVSSDSTISNTYYGGDCSLDVGIGSGSGSAIKIDEPVEEWAKNQDWYSANAVNSDGSLVWSADSPWNFETVWEFVENAPDYATNNGYPKLKVFSSQVIYWTDEAVWSAAGKDFNSYTLSGSGSQGDPYLIQSEWDLAYLSWTIYYQKPLDYVGSDNVVELYYSGIYFEQTADIDLSAYYWQPIGINHLRDGTYEARYFSGNYKGDGHIVSGVFTPAGTGDGYTYQGLFGCFGGFSTTITATISNVGVINSFVQGYQYVGGVVGDAELFCMITNCYNTGSVSGLSNVGGVVGFADNSAVTNCYNTGSVNASGNYVGGVVGSVGIHTGVVENCYNTGLVSGSSKVGGVVGEAYSCTITNCYNIGSVESSASVGGVVGYASSSTVTNCGFEGVINGSNNVGAIVGQLNNSSDTISNCYAVAESDSEISLVGSNSGSGTIENIVGIITSGGTSKKVYTGSDFSGFAWLNFDSSPVPKGLSWAGQFQEPPAEYAGNSNWILTKMQSEGWSAI